MSCSKISLVTGDDEAGSKKIAGSAIDPTITPTPSSAQQHSATYQAGIGVLLQLREAFPSAFNRLSAYTKPPLKVGIGNDLVQLLPEIPPKTIGIALRIYCRDAGYLRAMKAGTPRRDLDGKPVGAVTVEQAIAARASLDKKLKLKTPPAPPAPPPAPRKGLGLSELRAAAAARKAKVAP